MELGYVVAKAYTSYAEIPIKDAVVSVYSSDGENSKLIGVRLTDESGKTLPVPVEAPNMNLSIEPGNDMPYSVVNVRVDHPDYNTFYVEGVQVFAGRVSLQNAEMIPTGEHISYDKKSDLFYIEKNDIL